MNAPRKRPPTAQGSADAALGGKAFAGRRMSVAPPKVDAAPWQLPLLDDREYAVTRHRFTVPMPLRKSPLHEVSMEVCVSPGEVEGWTSCPCHGTSTLHIDLFRCACFGTSLVTECAECRDRSIEIEGSLASIVVSERFDYWDESAGEARWTDGLYARVAPFVASARTRIDPLIARTALVACPELREWLYWVLIDHRRNHAAMLELLRLRPALLRLFVYLDDDELMAMVETGAGIRELERALTQAHGVPAWLVRGLPVHTRPEDILCVSGCTLPASDAPRDPEERARWIHSIARVLRALDAGITDVDEMLRSAVAAQASRHYAGMAELSEIDIERYVEYLEDAETLPLRTYDAQRLMAWVEHGIEESDLLCDFDIPDAWQAPPLPGLRSAEISITPIHTKAALIAEGDAMHHCIVSYAPMLAAGRVCVYHVEHATGPSTLMLEPISKRRFRVREHMGVCNGAVAHEVTLLVERWLKQAMAPTQTQET